MIFVSYVAVVCHGLINVVPSLLLTEPIFSESVAFSNIKLAWIFWVLNTQLIIFITHNKFDSLIYCLYPVLYKKIL